MALKNVLAFWLRKSKKSGATFMGGKVEENLTLKKGQSVFIFKNEDKESENHPDYRLAVEVEDQQEAFV